MSEYKKDRSRKNIERTAKFLDRMIVNGITDLDTGKKRKANLDDVLEYLQFSDFDSVAEFNEAVGVTFPALQDYFDERTFGYGNHILAAVDTLMSRTGLDSKEMTSGPLTFDSIKSEWMRNKKERDVASELNAIENPAESFGARAAGMIGTIPTGMKLEKQLRKGAQKLGAGRKMSSAIAVPAAGGTEGAIYGSSEVLDSALEDDGKALEKTIGMLYMGGAGALGSLFGYGLGKTVQGALSPVFRFFGGGADEEAANVILNTVKQGQSELTGLKYNTVNDAIQELAERRRVAPESQPVLGDLNEDARLMTGAIVEGMSPEVRDPAMKLFRDRQMGGRSQQSLKREGGQAARMSQNVQDLTGQKESNVFLDIEVLKKKKMEDADDGYKQAYTESPVDDTTEVGQKLLYFMTQPEFMDAYEAGLKINRKRRMLDPTTPAMRPMEEVFNDQNSKFSIVELDYTQRGYRDVQSIKGKATDRKNALGPEEFGVDVGILKEFQSLIREASPQWGKTFDKYATDSNANRAMEAGQASLNKSPKAIEAQLEGMTEGEREFFKIGAAQRVYEFFGTGIKRGTNVAKMIDEDPKKTEAIETIFGDMTKMRDFMKQVIAENEAAKTSQFMNQSQSKRMLAMEKRLEEGDAAVQQGVQTAATVTYSPVWAMRELATGAAGKNPFGKKRRGEIATQVGMTLTEPNPATQAMMLRAAERLAARKPVERRMRRKATAGLLGRAAIDQQRREREAQFQPLSTRGRGILFN